MPANRSNSNSNSESPRRTTRSVARSVGNINEQRRDDDEQTQETGRARQPSPTRPNTRSTAKKTSGQDSATAEGQAAEAAALASAATKETTAADDRTKQVTMQSPNDGTGKDMPVDASLPMDGSPSPNDAPPLPSLGAAKLNAPSKDGSSEKEKGIEREEEATPPPPNDGSPNAEPADVPSPSNALDNLPVDIAGSIASSKHGSANKSAQNEKEKEKEKMNERATEGDDARKDKEAGKRGQSERHVEATPPLPQDGRVLVLDDGAIQPMVGGAVPNASAKYGCVGGERGDGKEDEPPIDATLELLIAAATETDAVPNHGGGDEDNKDGGEEQKEEERQEDATPPTPNDGTDANAHSSNEATPVSLADAAVPTSESGDGDKAQVSDILQRLAGDKTAPSSTRALMADHWVGNTAGGG